MKFDLGLFSFDLTDVDPVVPVLFSALSVADQQESIAAGPTMAKTKPVAHRRSFSVAVALPKEGEDKAKAIERTLGEVTKRSQQPQLRSQEDRTHGGSPAKLAEIAHKQGQTPLRSLVLITFVDQWIVTALHTGLDNKKNEKAMRDQMDAFAKSLKKPA
jgi:hypothetical protein